MSTSHPFLVCRWHGSLTRYAKLRVEHAPGMPGTFSPPPRVSDPDMHHGACVTHVPWRMPGLLTSGFPWSRRRWKRSRYSRRNFTYLIRGPWPSYWALIQMWHSTSCFTRKKWNKNDNNNGENHHQQKSDVIILSKYIVCKLQDLATYW